MRKTNLYIGTIISASFTTSALAQVPVAANTSLAGHFFVSVLAGVIIAIGIQFLLSNLAIALGITAIGDIRDLDSSDGDDDSSDSHSGSYTKSIGRKLSAGLGLFTIITMSVSLFGATWLAIELSLVNTVLNGAIVGIVIWALFFLLALFVDVKLTTAICGNLVSFIQQGLTGASSAVSGMFSQSDQSKARTFARETVKAIHDEVRKEFDTSDLDKKIKQYIDRATDNEFTPEKIRKELETLINEIEIEEKYVTDDPEASKKLVMEIASQRPSLSEKQKQQLSSALDDIKASVKEHDSHQARATAAFDKLSPGDEEQGKKYREQVREYLDNTGRDELSAEEIEKDIEKIFDNPASAQRIIKDRVNQLDRDSIKALLAAHKDMDKDKADKILTAYDAVLKKLQDSGSDDTSASSSTANLPAKRSQAEVRVQRWFDRMQRPELRYTNLKRDFMEILNNPSDAPQILRKRIQQMDEKSVRALLTNNQYLDESDIDEYLSKYEEARQEMLQRIDSMQAEAKKRISLLKKRALEESEGIRATAASAAWWLFVSALVSAGAASLAGAMASGLI